MRPPEWFVAAIRNYDYELEVHYHPHRQEFAVERRVKHSTSGRLLEIKKYNYRLANRKMRSGLEPEQEKRQFALKLRAQSIVQALGHCRMPLMFFQRADSDHLQAVLSELRAGDNWSAAERLSIDPMRDPEKAAQRMGAVADYEEEFEKAKRDIRRRDEVRYGAKQVYTHIQYSSGARISMAGVG